MRYIALMAGPLSVLFVSATGRIDRPILDPITRYRCFYFAEELAELGHVANVVSLAAFAESPIFDYDLYVFHRPSVQILGIIERLRRHHKRLIADFDEFAFDRADGFVERARVRRADTTQQLSTDDVPELQLFHAATASTAILSEQLSKLHPRSSIRVLPNALPTSILMLSERLHWVSAPRVPTAVGYFPDKWTSNTDFETSCQLLELLLDMEPSLRLFVAAPAALRAPLFDRYHVLHEPSASEDFLPPSMLRAAVTIASLADNALNRARSRVPFLEASLCGSYLVATPIPDLEGFANAAMALPVTAEDWCSAILAGLDAFRLGETHSNYSYVREHCHARAGAEAFLELAEAE